MSLAAVLNTLVERVVTPRQIGVYNGVAARDCGLVSRHEPQHKAVLAGAVRDVVTPGDRVIVVGGGRAVVAVHAARHRRPLSVSPAPSPARPPQTAWTRPGSRATCSS